MLPKLRFTGVTLKQPITPGGPVPDKIDLVLDDNNGKHLEEARKKGLLSKETDTLSIRLNTSAPLLESANTLPAEWDEELTHKINAFRTVSDLFAALPDVVTRNTLGETLYKRYQEEVEPRLVGDTLTHLGLQVLDIFPTKQYVPIEKRVAALPEDTSKPFATTQCSPAELEALLVEMKMSSCPYKQIYICKPLSSKITLSRNPNDENISVIGTIVKSHLGFSLRVNKGHSMVVNKCKITEANPTLLRSGEKIHLQGLTINIP